MNAPVIELKNASLYRGDRSLLSDLNWTVNKGEHWVVLGRNGAGKTLLLKIIAGYLWPSEGRVQILEERLGAVDLRDLRRSIGWVSSALAEKIPGGDNVLEVVLSGVYATFGLYEEPSGETVGRAEAMMDDMGLTRLAESKFAVLSAGEKQRVLLARARLADPSLLILDEPCAGLDLAAREKFLALVQTMAETGRGPTMIMVTHRVVEIMPGFTHCLMLKQGRILATGPVNEVMTDENLSLTMEIPVQLSRRNGRWQVYASAPGEEPVC